MVVAAATANLRTKIMDFRGFYSSIILMLRGGILMSIGNFLVTLSQAILVGIMLAGRSGVVRSSCYHASQNQVPYDGKAWPTQAGYSQVLC